MTEDPSFDRWYTENAADLGKKLPNQFGFKFALRHAYIAGKRAALDPHAPEFIKPWQYAAMTAGALKDEDERRGMLTALEHLADVVYPKQDEFVIPMAGE